MTMPQMGNKSEYLNCGPMDLTDNGICTQCGEYCTNRLPISDSDIRRIRRYIRRHGIRPVGHIPAVIAGTALDMVCPFLDDTKSAHKCLIYPVRLLDGLFFCMIQQYAQLEKNQLYKKSLINEQAVSFRKKTASSIMRIAVNAITSYNDIVSITYVQRQGGSYVFTYHKNSVPFRTGGTACFSYF